MPNAYTLAGKPGAPVASVAPRRPFSKPELARLVLAGTTATLCTVLLLWLLLARLAGPVVRSSAIVAGTLGLPSAVAREPVFAVEDSRLFGASDRRGAPMAASRRDFTRAVEALLSGKTRGPIVVYLAAVGASTPTDPDGDRAFLFTPGANSATRAVMVPVTEVLKLFKAKPSTPKLLILDAAQVGSDRDLGVFGNGFTAQLKALIDRDANLVVLTSCAPGQLSWTSEVERRSAFAHYVAEGLSGRAAGWGGVTVRNLLHYVQAGVSRWAEQNRAAIQTPVLLGNDRLDFALPTLTAGPRPTDPPPPDAVKALRDDLLKEWTERGRLAASAPYRHAPLPWRLYQDSLLRAERLLRAGRIDEADKALSLARESGTEVKLLLSGPPLAHPRSLAMLDRTGRDADEAAGGLDAQRERYLQAIHQLIDDSGANTPEDAAKPASDKAGAKPEDKAKSAPNDPPTPKDDPKAKAKAKTDAKPDAKTDAKPKPKAEAAKAGKSAPSKPGDKPGADGAAETPPIAVLAQDTLHSVPTYVEGQLPLWYAAFVRLGGETDALRDARRDLLHKAVNFRLVAERAAASDERLIPWVRPLVDAADTQRRRAQDLLFAGETGPFHDADRALGEANDTYEQALQVAGRCGKALDLIQRLQDELPYYGDWIAHRGEEPDDAFDRLLDRAAELARLVHAVPDRAEEIPDQSLKIGELADDVQKQTDRLARDVRAAVQRSAGKSSSAGWREVDALLRMPMVPADDRAALLDRAGSPELSPPFGADVTGLDEPPATEPDPIVWTQALVLARLELGLLAIAGRDVGTLPELYKKARATRGKDPAQAFDDLDRFSARVRAIRAELVRANGEESGTTDRTEAQLRQALSAADRAARVLGPADLEELRLDGDPARRMDEFNLHALLLWHGRRLSDDFAPRHAEQLLVDAQGWMSSRTLKDAFTEARHRLDAALAIKADDAAGAVLNRKEQLRVQIESRGDVPPGLAVPLFAHDPAIPLVVARARAADDPLVAVPVPTNPPTVRDYVVERNVAVKVNPEIFYRGRSFSAPVSREVGARRDLVELEIHQRYTQYKFRGKTRHADQFALNQTRGYLHPRSDLVYKLVVRNKTADPLTVCVSHGLPGQKPTTKTLTLQGHETNESVEGAILPLELPDDKPKTLTVNVTEGDEHGPPLCAPLEVEFLKVHPKEFITAMDGFDGRIFFVCVTHEGGSDPVPLPAEVRVKVEPGTSFREVGSSVAHVDRGEMRVFRFLMLPGKDVPEVKWTVDAEGVAKVVEGSFQMQEVPKPPPAPPAAPPKL